MGDTLTEELRHSSSSSTGRGSTSNREEPVTVVKVRRLLKVGQEGVKGQKTCTRRKAGPVDVEKGALLGRTESISVGMGDRVGRVTATMGDDLEVEVMKKEGRGKGVNFSKVGSKLLHEKSQNRNQVVEDKPTERKNSEMTPPCNLETKALETNCERRKAIGLEREVESRDLVQDQGDQLLKFSSQNLELEIDAKLKELKLKNTAGGIEGQLEQEVEVEEMTSEDYYYDPHGHYAVHEEALKDDSRMQIWQQVR